MTEDLECNGQILNDIATYKTAVLLTNGLDTVAGSLATEIDLDDSVNVAATKRINFTGTGEIERGITGHIRLVNLPTTASPATNLLGYNTATNVVETTAISAPTDWSTFPATTNSDIASFQINNLRNITGTNVRYEFDNTATIQCLSATINVGPSQIAVSNPVNTITLKANNIFLDGKITGLNAPTTGFFLTSDSSSFFEWKDPAAITVGFTQAYNNVNGAVAGAIPYNTANDTTGWLPPPAQDNCFLKFNQAVTPNRFEWELTTVTQFRQSKMFPQNVLENPYGVLNVGPGFIPSGWSYFECAVNHPNGYVYFLPYDTRRITRLNPETGVSDTYDGYINSSGAKFACAITASDMKIYAPPYQGETNWLVYNPYTNTHTTIAASTNSYVCVTQVGNFLYALVTDGTSTSEIYKLNITTGIETPVATSLPADSWWGCCIGVDGKIYYAPYESSNVLVLDPTTDTTALLPTGLARTAAMYKSVCMAQNGNLYFAPYNQANLMILNTRTSTFSLITDPIFATANAYSGITASTNNQLYMCPYGANSIAIVNPALGTINTTLITGLNASFGTEKWSQMLLLQNATEMVLVPFRVGTGGVTTAASRTVKSGQPTIPAWMLSQNLNKQ